jgi:hypothetical protein
VQQIEKIEEARQRGEIDEREAEEVEGQILEQQVSRARPTAESGEDAQHG